MGKKHREERAREKKTLRHLGVRENEFGELQHVGTKADARRRLLRSLAIRQEFEVQVIFQMSERARQDIVAQEDARVVAEIATFALTL